MGNTHRSKKNTTPSYLNSRIAQQYPIPLYTLGIIHKNLENIRTRRSTIRNADHFIVIWLDSSTNEYSDDAKHSLEQLKTIVDRIEIYSDPTKCVNFIKNSTIGKIFLIISGSLGQCVLPNIESLKQIDSIYIFCQNESKYRSLKETYKNIKGIFTHIESLCEMLKNDIRPYESNFLKINIAPNVPFNDTNQLDQSFIYFHLIKEILLEFDYDDNSKEKFIEFARQHYHKNEQELAIIDEFEKTCTSSFSTQWYAYQSLLYSMFNKALQLQDIEFSINIGYFICDLHRQIKEMQQKRKLTESLIVYRRQRINEDEFENLRQSNGHLLSFSNFLWTSTIENGEMNSIYSNRKHSNLIDILFHIRIDSSITSATFTILDDIHNNSHNERGVLFSMFNTYRIVKIEKQDERVWSVGLQPINENDEHIEKLNEQLRNKFVSRTAIHRMGEFLTGIGSYQKAEEIYSLLLDQTAQHDFEELAFIHYQLGNINYERGNLKTAESHTKYSIRVGLKFFPWDHPQLSILYSQMGIILIKQGHARHALEYFQFALENDLLANDPDQLKIAIRLSNIGLAYKEHGRYHDALNCYEKALRIYQSQFSTNHIDIAKIYNNLGLVYNRLDNKSMALSYFEKTLELEEKSLANEHMTLALTHYHIAAVLEDLKDYQKAIEHARKADDIYSHSTNIVNADTTEIEMYKNHFNKLQSMF